MTKFVGAIKRIAVPLVLICAALVALGVVALVIAEALFDVVHDDRAMAQRVRKNVTEQTAVQVAVLLQKEEKDGVQRTIDALTLRGSEFLSIGIRRNSGDVYAQTAGHERHWVPLRDGKSTMTHVAVPIYAGRDLWGHVEASYPPMTRTVQLRDDVATVQRVRETMAAHLSMQLAVLVELGDKLALQQTIDAISGRDGELLSIGLRRPSGDLYAGTANHGRDWIRPTDGKSTVTHLTAPIQVGRDVWGDLEVSFRP